MPNPDTGITPLPNGGEVHWSREEVSEEAARLFADQAAAKRFRVLSLQEVDGTFTVRHFDVPGEWLHALLYDWEDGPGEGERVLSVVPVEGAALWMVDDD